MPKITVHSKANQYGIIYGKIDEYNWYALVQDEKVSYAIDPKNLEKGWGKVSRLFIYKNITEKNSARQEILRLVIADYSHKWNFLENQKKDLILKLVNYLELRYSLKILSKKAK